MPGWLQFNGDPLRRSVASSYLLRYHHCIHMVIGHAWPISGEIDFWGELCGVAVTSFGQAIHHHETVFLLGGLWYRSCWLLAAWIPRFDGGNSSPRFVLDSRDPAESDLRFDDYSGLRLPVIQVWSQDQHSSHSRHPQLTSHPSARKHSSLKRGRRVSG